MIYQNRCTFLQLKLFFVVLVTIASSCAHQTRAKFFASFPKYYVWLVIKLVIRVGQGQCGGKGLVLRPPRGIATQVERVEEKTGTKITQTNKNKLK